MKITIQAHMTKDSSIVDVELRNKEGITEPDERRVILTFPVNMAGEVEMNLSTDELINALLAVNGDYSINSLREAYNRRIR